MRRSFAVLTGLLLGGCAIVSVPPAGTAFDGSYVGQDTLLGGAAFQCGDPSLPEQIDIRDGRFSYPFQVSPPRVSPLPVQVAADGTLAGQMQYFTGEEGPLFLHSRTDWVLVRGRIDGSRLDATITNLRCARRLTAQRNRIVGAN